MRTSLIATAIGALLLSACTSIGSLKIGSDEISAAVTRNLFGPDRIEVTLNGKVYRGDWILSPPAKEQTEGQPRRHRQHIASAKQTLKADDGSEMTCQWKTHLYAYDGNCTIGGREYALSMGQQW